MAAGSGRRGGRGESDAAAAAFAAHPCRAALTADSGASAPAADSGATARAATARAAAATPACTRAAAAEPARAAAARAGARSAAARAARAATARAAAAYPRRLGHPRRLRRCRHCSCRRSAHPILRSRPRCQQRPLRSTSTRWRCRRNYPGLSDTRSPPGACTTGLRSASVARTRPDLRRRSSHRFRPWLWFRPFRPSLPRTAGRGLVAAVCVAAPGGQGGSERHQCEQSWEPDRSESRHRGLLSISKGNGSRTTSASRFGGVATREGSSNAGAHLGPSMVPDWQPNKS